MIYDVRLREILTHEFQVEGDDLKGAFLIAVRKAHSKKFKSTPIRRYFELESLNKGKHDEFTPASKSSKRTDRTNAKRKDS